MNITENIINFLNENLKIEKTHVVPKMFGLSNSCIICITLKEKGTIERNKLEEILDEIFIKQHVRFRIYVKRKFSPY